jgi:hypothetical protein
VVAQSELVAIENLVPVAGRSGCDTGTPTVEFVTKLVLVARSRLKSRASLEAENIVLRQQVIVLSRKDPSRSGSGARIG